MVPPEDGFWLEEERVQVPWKVLLGPSEEAAPPEELLSRRKPIGPSSSLGETQQRNFLKQAFCVDAPQ